VSKPAAFFHATAHVFALGRAKLALSRIQMSEDRVTPVEAVRPGLTLTLRACSCWLMLSLRPAKPICP